MRSRGELGLRRKEGTQSSKFATYRWLSSLSHGSCSPVSHLSVPPLWSPGPQTPRPRHHQSQSPPRPSWDERQCLDTGNWSSLHSHLKLHNTMNPHFWLWYDGDGYWPESERGEGGRRGAGEPIRRLLVTPTSPGVWPSLSPVFVQWPHPCLPSIRRDHIINTNFGGRQGGWRVLENINPPLWSSGSALTKTGCCRDLTASAAEMEPTLERWRLESAVTCWDSWSSWQSKHRNNKASHWLHWTRRKQYIKTFYRQTDYTSSVWREAESA